LNRRAESPDVRETALDILQRVEQGAFASILLDDAEPRFRDRRDERLLHALVLGVVRRRSALDHVVAAVASRPPSRMDPLVLQAARLGAYELLYLDRVPDFAAVATAVEVVKRRRGKTVAGFVNAVLRRVAERGAELLPPRVARGDVGGLALRESHPRWWVERVVSRLGWDAAARLVEANNRPAPTVLRPNLRRTTRERLAARLAADGIETESGRFAPDALRMDRGSTSRCGALTAGEAWVQDEASQLVPLLFGPGRAARVADLCAAPGSKTMQLAEGLEPDGLLLAVDRHRKRLRRLRAAAARLGIAPPVVVCADARYGRSLVACRFDRVLVDAPCSGTGTLRRHPEIRWRLTPDDFEALAARQLELLRAGAALTAPGGRLVYSVCSLEPEEGERVVRAFLDGQPRFRRFDPRHELPAAAAGLVDDGGQLHTSPEAGIDGFFAAALTSL
jgi:16S rRNA (cytosine967-C5)-methyltransferase